VSIVPWIAGGIFKWVGTYPLY